MKIIKRIILVVILLGSAAMGYFYFGTYSEGIRSGIVIKGSRKGFLFKTYEGQLNQSSNNLIARTFDFSVSTNETEVIKALEEASANEEWVSLHYVEKFVTFPWRGDTKYLIVRVERQSKPPSQ